MMWYAVLYWDGYPTVGDAPKVFPIEASSREHAAFEVANRVTKDDSNPLLLVGILELIY